MPNIIIAGPPGTGKTSTILAVARALYGATAPSMVLELNASDARGIDVVRQQIVDFASTRTIFGAKFKLVVLDECDAMTKDAQFALRRVIEKYTRNARFALIANYASKIIPALQSRCTRFRFPPLPDAEVSTRVAAVAAAERVHLGDGGLEAVVALAGGDMRKALNILQASSLAASSVDAAAVYSCTGNPTPADVEAAASSLLNSDVAAAVGAVEGMQAHQGFALTDIVRALHPLVARLAMPQPARADLLAAMADCEAALAAGVSERLQLGALAGAFAVARDAIVAAAV
jgi:replication factor C subunit 3/5